MYKNISHTVIVVTYNHEKYIAESLDSILMGTFVPSEVIIVDDFSSDSTVEIIDRYKNQYPKIIQVVKNESNLGVFDNLNKIYDLPVKGEIISFLGGDDVYDKNLLSEINAEVIRLKLNPSQDKFLMLPRVANLFLDGSKQELDNSLIENGVRKFNPFQIALRSKLYSMHVGISLKLYQRWARFPVGAMSTLGIYADLPHFLSNIIECDLFVPVNASTTFHRVGVGVTSRVNVLTPQKSRHRVMQLILDKYENILNLSDRMYIRFLMAIDSVYISKSIIAMLTAILIFPIGIAIERIDRRSYFYAISSLIKDCLAKLVNLFRKL